MAEFYDRYQQPSAANPCSLVDDSSSGGPQQPAASATMSTRTRTLDQFLEQAYHQGYTQQDPPDYRLFVNQHNNCTEKVSYVGMVLCMGLANASDATEILCLSYLLSNATFQSSMLDNDLAVRGSILAASVFGGMLLGGLIFGDLGDVHGRKPILLLGLRLNAVAGFLSALAPPNSVLFMSVLRFIAGVGIGATVPPLFTLATELSPPSLRGRVVTCVASFWMVGSIFVALVAILCFQWLSTDGADDEHAVTDAHIFGVAPWRFFAMVCALPSAAASYMAKRHVPESPRYLAIQKALDPAVQQRFHSDAVHHANELALSMGVTFILMTEEVITTDGTATADRHTHPQADADQLRTLPSYTLRELNQTFQCKKSLSQSSQYSSLHNNHNNSSWSMSDKLKLMMISFQRLYNGSKSLRRTTLLLQLCWFTLCFGTYGLLTWINTLFDLIHMENPYVNGLLFALANLPGNIVSFILLDKAWASRSAIFAYSLVAAAISLLIFAAGARAVQQQYQSEEEQEQEGSSSSWASWIVVIFACLFQACTICSWNTIDTITSESFPTTSRSTGTGICTASGRVGALVAQFVNGALLHNSVDGDGDKNNNANSSGVASVIIVASVMLLVGALAPCASSSGDMTARPLQDDVVKEHGESDIEEIDSNDESESDINASTNTNTAYRDNIDISMSVNVNVNVAGVDVDVDGAASNRVMLTPLSTPSQPCGSGTGTSTSNNNTSDREHAPLVATIGDGVGKRSHSSRPSAISELV
jgi:MFS family permease